MEYKLNAITRKRTFILLTIASGLLISLLACFLYEVMEPGLARIAHILPSLWGMGLGVLMLLMWAGIMGIIMALMGIPVFKLFYFWSWKVVNLLFPLSVFLGKLGSLTLTDIEDSFIEVNNCLVLHQHIKVEPERILLLTPHCIQRDTCVHKITRNVGNCRQCGGCSVGSMLALANKVGCKFVVATGGTLARQMVKEARPKAIVAIACERDLTSGIQDVFPLPVLGVLNERPFGPCFNTRVDMDKLEAAVNSFLEAPNKAF